MALTLTNLVPTPTFENGSVGGWTASAGTLAVSTDKSAFGTKSLKSTSTASGQTIVISAASSPFINIQKAYGLGIRLAGSASMSVSIGQHYFNGSGTELVATYPSMVSKSIGTTLTRYVSGPLYVPGNLTGLATIKPVIVWTSTASGQSVYIDTVTHLRYGDYDYASHPWGDTSGYVDFPDVIGSMAAAGNITYAWAGTAEASLSTASSGAALSLSSTVNRASTVTVTGTGFVPGASVGLRIADDDQANGRTGSMMATVTANGSGGFTYNWTVGAKQGYRWFVAQTTTGWGTVSSPIAVKGAAAAVPTTNYFINPSFRTSKGTAPYVFNVCTNPTPTVDLTGWTAVGSATVTRSTSAKILGPSHGARVVSTSSTDGIALPWMPPDWDSPGHTAYVRAVTNCTLKISPVGDAGAPSATVDTVGWGDDGWGGTGYVSGDTIALTAGQVIRARLNVYTGSTTSGFSTRMKITGSGTFDVDAVWQGIGVADGDTDAPGSVPWFCGATPSDADFTYQWFGTAYASGSARVGRTALGVLTNEGDAPDGTSGTGTVEFDHGHLTTRSGGETALAIRGAQWFFNSYPRFANASGATTAIALGLEVGKTYMLSLDLILDYSITPGGYNHDGSNGNETWLDAGSSEAQPKVAIPGRGRVHVPFNVDTGTEQLGLTNYWGWLLGEGQITKVTLTESALYSANDSPQAVNDLTALVDPGTSVMVSATSSGPTADVTIALQAQVSGSWSTIGSVVIPVDDWEMTSTFLADIPSGATGVRLNCSDPDAIYGFTVSAPPVDYFDGSTPAADGWSYAWAGTPDASFSTRTLVTGPSIKVFQSGTAVNVSEARIVLGGSLVKITAARGPVTQMPPSGGRSTLTPGTYQPGPTTTGVLPGTTLTPHNTGGGVLTVTTTNQVFENLDIHGDIVVQAGGVQFINCRLRGGLNWPTSQTAIVDCRHASAVASPPLLVDCTIAADRPSYYRDGIMGSFTARRCNISHVNDGLGIYNTNVLVGATALAEANWIHDLVYWYPEPAHTDGTHNDCIQIQSGGDIHVIGNFLEATAVLGDDRAYADPDGGTYAGGALSGVNPDKPYQLSRPNGAHANGAGVIVQRNTGIALSNTVIVEKNYFSHGMTALNLKAGTYKVQDNWIHRASFYTYTSSPTSQYPIRPTDSTVGAGITGLYTTNKYTDNSEVLTEANAGIRY